MTAAPYLLGRRGPGAAVVTGGGSGATDGGFVADPIVTTTASGNTTVKGQVKPGSFGKFVYPLATIAAGRQYTFRYTPQFSQLAQQGKLAMVGFGLKNSNDFHIVGLRGDGSTGLHKYQVNGTPPNGWNKDSGHTTSDGGGAANGTQAGPNYIRLVVSADGATYKFQTSPNGSAWTDEYTGQAPTPFANVSGVATFGIALWFNNADAGPFSIVIDQFADVVTPVTDPFFSSVVLLCGFDGVNGATTSSDESAAAHSLTFNGNAVIDTAQSKFGTSSCFFDGSGSYISIPDSADWKLSAANSDQFTVEFWIRRHASPVNMRVIGQASSTSNAGWYVNWGNTNVILFLGCPTGSTGSAWTTSNTASSPALDTWGHIAIDKDATGKCRMYVNGVMLGSVTPADSSMFDSTAALEIGRLFGATANLSGWMDELRITKGVARYASDAGFTVPSAAFPRS
jgi:hypothetical protein